MTIHDDGSLTKSDMELFQMHLPRCRVIVRSEADQRMDDVLRGYPRCQRMRRALRFHCALKLFDPWVYSPTDVIVLMDSDILFFRRPHELLECAEKGKACFNADYQDAYAVRTGEIRHRMGIDVLDRVNAGLLVLEREKFDLDLVEQYFTTFPAPIHDLNRHEQTLYALLLSQAGAHRLSKVYQISKQPIEAATVSHHFVSDGSRLHFSTRGLKTLRRRGVLAAIS